MIKSVRNWNINRAKWDRTKTVWKNPKFKLNCLDFRQLGLKSQTEHVQFLSKKFKSRTFEIWTCRKQNSQKFRFWHFPIFGHSDFGIPLYFIFPNSYQAIKIIYIIIMQISWSVQYSEMMRQFFNLNQFLSFPWLHFFSASSKDQSYKTILM